MNKSPSQVSRRGSASDESTRGTRLGRARRVVVLAVALLAGVVVGAGAVGASAGLAYSQWGYYSVNGINYRNQAYVNTSSGTASGATLVGGSTQSVPSGWAGVRGRLFNNSNVMVCQSGILYNSSSIPAGSTWVNSCGVSGSGSYHSYGVTWGWNGSSYNAFYTFNSPSQNS